MARRLATLQRRLSPHAVLALGVALVAACEYGREEARFVGWVLVELLVGAVVLTIVWFGRDRLRLPQVLVLALALHLAWLAARSHASLGLDVEWRDVYARQGQELLDGHYPRSEYPAGAVSLFAFEAWLGGAHTRFAHALVMVPFQLASVWAVWSLRTRWSPWFAAVLAFWPLDAWFWEFRFDLVPTGLLAVGLALAWRRRWALAGIALGLGSAVKWSPALAALPLLAFLLTSRRPREALRLALGAVGAIAVVYIPYLVWSPDDVLAAYSKQGVRSITDESVWHLPLHALGLESRHGYAYPAFDSVGPPAWADTLAIVVQIALLVAVTGLGASARRLRDAVVLGAMTPVLFLVANRVFSVQYFVLLLAAWLVAAALLAERERDAAAMSALALAATAANVLILPYPFRQPHLWEAASAVRFALGLALTGWIVVRASRQDPLTAAAPAGTRLRPRC